MVEHEEHEEHEEHAEDDGRQPASGDQLSGIEERRSGKDQTMIWECAVTLAFT